MAEKSRFCPWWLWPLTLTFKLVRARDKHVFCVNLAQIRSAVPEIFHTQTKKVSDSLKTEFHAVSSMRTVKSFWNCFSEQTRSMVRSMKTTNNCLIMLHWQQREWYPLFVRTKFDETISATADIVSQSLVAQHRTLYRILQRNVTRLLPSCTRSYRLRG